MLCNDGSQAGFGPRGELYAEGGMGRKNSAVSDRAAVTRSLRRMKSSCSGSDEVFDAPGLRISRGTKLGLAMWLV